MREFETRSIAAIEAHTVAIQALTAAVQESVTLFGDLISQGTHFRTFTGAEAATTTTTSTTTTTTTTAGE